MNIRKLAVGLLISTLIVTVVGTFGFASAAGAQAVQYESVECTLNNYTDPEHQNWDGSYFEGTPLQFEAHLTDPDGHVKNIRFIAAQENKGGMIQEGTSTSAIWEHPLPGLWTVVAQLFDDAGREIIPNGDCDVNIVVVSQAATPEPTLAPPTAEPAPEQTSAVAPAPQPTTPAPAELAYTGASTILLLTVASIMLIAIGTVLASLSQRKLREEVSG